MAIINYLENPTGDNFEVYIAHRAAGIIQAHKNPLHLNEAIQVCVPNSNNGNFKVLNVDPNSTIKTPDEVVNPDNVWFLNSPISYHRLQEITGQDNPRYWGTTFADPNINPENKHLLYPEIDDNGSLLFPHQITHDLNKTKVFQHPTVMNGVVVNINNHKATRLGLENIQDTHGDKVRVILVNASDGFGQEIVQSFTELLEKIDEYGITDKVILLPQLTNVHPYGISEERIPDFGWTSMIYEEYNRLSMDNHDPKGRNKFLGGELIAICTDRVDQLWKITSRVDSKCYPGAEIAYLQAQAKIRVFRDHNINGLLAMGVVHGKNSKGKTISGLTDVTARAGRGMGVLPALATHFFKETNPLAGTNPRGAVYLKYAPPGNQFNKSQITSISSQMLEKNMFPLLTHPWLIIASEFAGYSDLSPREYQTQFQDKVNSITNK